MRHSWIVAVFMVAACGQLPQPEMGGNPGSGGPPPGRRTGMTGGTVGNGGDDRPFDEGSAWFVGPRRINFCVDVAKDFGAGEFYAKAMVLDAMYRWKIYIATHNVNARPPFFQSPAPIDTSLVLNFKEKLECDGTEDLAFYFGTENPDVETARANYINPLGFAHRYFYNRFAHWGKGFIWLAKERSHSSGFPNWNDTFSLPAMLLHELGHVLGNSHVSGTIMDVDIVKQLRRIDPSVFDPQNFRFRMIDGKRMLYLPVYSDSISMLRGSEPQNPTQWSFYGLNELFVTQGELLIFGSSSRTLAGPIFRGVGPFKTMPFGLLVNAPIAGKPGNAQVRAGTTAPVLKIDKLVRTSWHKNDAPIFKVSYEWRPPGPDWFYPRPVTLYHNTHSVSFMGEDRDEPGSAILIEVNGGSFRTRVQRKLSDGTLEEIATW